MPDGVARNRTLVTEFVTARTGGVARPIQIRRERDVGHGTRAVSQAVEVSVDTLAFAARWTGLALWPSTAATASTAHFPPTCGCAAAFALPTSMSAEQRLPHINTRRAAVVHIGAVSTAHPARATRPSAGRHKLAG
jgi:hypothetical protein